MKGTIFFIGLVVSFLVGFSIVAWTFTNSGIPHGSGSSISTSTLDQLYCRLGGCGMDGGLRTPKVTTDTVIAPGGKPLRLGNDSGYCDITNGREVCSNPPETPFYAIPAGTTSYTLSATRVFQERSWTHPFRIVRMTCRKTNSVTVTDGGVFNVYWDGGPMCECYNLDAGRKTALCTNISGMLEAPCYFTDGGACHMPANTNVNFRFSQCVSGNPIVDDCVLYGYFE